MGWEKLMPPLSAGWVVKNWCMTNMPFSDEDGHSHARFMIEYNKNTNPNLELTWRWTLTQNQISKFKSTLINYEANIEWVNERMNQPWIKQINELKISTSMSQMIAKINCFKNNMEPRMNWS